MKPSARWATAGSPRGVPRPRLEPTDVHYPGTYAAGVYNRLKTAVGEREVENESLVNLPNWLPLSFRIEVEVGSTSARRSSLITVRHSICAERC